jgi:hypothetical protein
MKRIETDLATLSRVAGRESCLLQVDTDRPDVPIVRASPLLVDLEQDAQLSQVVMAVVKKKQHTDRLEALLKDRSKCTLDTLQLYQLQIVVRAVLDALITDRKRKLPFVDLKKANQRVKDVAKWWPNGVLYANPCDLNMAQLIAILSAALAYFPYWDTGVKVKAELAKREHRFKSPLHYWQAVDAFENARTEAAQRQPAGEVNVCVAAFVDVATMAA